jgi:hypothetical protein
MQSDLLLPGQLRPLNYHPTTPTTTTYHSTNSRRWLLTSTPSASGIVCMHRTNRQEKSALSTIKKYTSIHQAYSAIAKNSPNSFCSVPGQAPQLTDPIFYYAVSSDVLRAQSIPYLQLHRRNGRISFPALSSTRTPLIKAHRHKAPSRLQASSRLHT